MILSRRAQGCGWLKSQKAIWILWANQNFRSSRWHVCSFCRMSLIRYMVPLVGCLLHSQWGLRLPVAFYGNFEERNTHVSWWSWSRNQMEAVTRDSTATSEKRRCRNLEWSRPAWAHLSHTHYMGTLVRTHTVFSSTLQFSSIMQ